MATAAQLASDVAAGLADVEYVATLAPWSRAAEAVETHYFGSTSTPDAPTPFEVGLEISELRQSIQPQGGAGILTALRGRTALDLVGLRIPGRYVEAETLRLGMPPRILGAVSSGAWSAAIDGLVSDDDLRPGMAFRVAGQAANRWHVILTVESIDETSVTVEFYPPAPSAWSDNAQVLPVEFPPADTARWNAYTWRGRAASLDAVGAIAPSAGDSPERVAWASRQSLVSGAVVEAAVARLGEKPHLEVSLRQPGDRLEKKLATARPGWGACPLGEGAAYYQPPVATPDPWNPDDVSNAIAVWQFVAFVPQSVESETADLFVISNGSATTTSDNGWGCYLKTTTLAFVAYIAIGGTVYTATSSAVDKLETFWTVRCEFDQANNALRIRTMPWHDPDLPVTASADTTTSGTYAPAGSPAGLTVWAENAVAGITSGSEWQGLMPQLAILDLAAFTTAEAEEQMRRRILPTDTGLVALWHNDMDLTGDEWYDNGPSFDPSAATTSPFELTEKTTTAAFRGHSLGGGEDLEGTYPPYPVGRAQNVRGEPVAEGDYFAWQIAAGLAGPVLAVRDGGATQDPEAVKAALIDPEPLSMIEFQTTAPTSGDYSTYTGPAGTFVRFPAAATGEVTADLYACSLVDWGMHFDQLRRRSMPR